jgi:hypothetical protein
MRDRYLLGKWAAFEGLVHPGFDNQIHCISREQALKHLDKCLQRHVQVKMVEGYDFGIVSPTCYMLGFVDDVGRMFIIDGFYLPEFSYDLHPQAIFDIRSRYTGRLVADDPIDADPAIFRRMVIAGRKDTGDTLAKLHRDAGLIMKPASNDVVAGIAKVNSYLSGLQHIVHPITGERPAPLLYVVNELEWFQSEISAYYWKRNPQGQNIDEPVNSNDHAMNTLKYMLARLPEASKVVIPERALPPQWTYWHEMDVGDYQQMQRAF